MVLSVSGPLSSQCVLVLRSFGSQFSSLAETVSCKPFPSLIPFLSSSVVYSQAASLSSLLSDVTKTVVRLQKALLFVIRSSSAHSFGVSILQGGVDSDLLTENNETILSLTILKDYPINWRCRISQRQIASIDTSLIPLGSIRLLLFLYAQAVDLCASSSAQAGALRLLVLGLRRNPINMREFVAIDGYDVIVRCLSSRLAIFDGLVFNEILNAVLSNLDVDEGGSVFPTRSSVLVDPSMLQSIVCCASIWSIPGRFRFWPLLLKCLEFCISESGSLHYLFNRTQIARVNFLEGLLQVAEELFKHKNKKQLVIAFSLNIC
ncbi:hypothetical protein AB6A40_007515 [Gnathostoma spinigerum]|uniref:Uncharacterized protein n=1 Tax=Gnathostoma spinigerum TaxID=75299 RepID=A0ABD6ENE5_9BILA